MPVHPNGQLAPRPRRGLHTNGGRSVLRIPGLDRIMEQFVFRRVAIRIARDKAHIGRAARPNITEPRQIPLGKRQHQRPPIERNSADGYIDEVREHLLGMHPDVEAVGRRNARPVARSLRRAANPLVARRRRNLRNVEGAIRREAVAIFGRDLRPRFHNQFRRGGGRPDLPVRHLESHNLVGRLGYRPRDALVLGCAIRPSRIRRIVELRAEKSAAGIHLIVTRKRVVGLRFGIGNRHTLAR